ncbi:long-chain-fatty-acid--CoA ligase [Ranunculus cassubicifolius]
MEIFFESDAAPPLKIEKKNEDTKISRGIEVDLNESVFEDGELNYLRTHFLCTMSKMKVFAAQVESGKQGKNGEPSIGPVYRSLLSKDQFPPDEDIGIT